MLLFYFRALVLASTEVRFDVDSETHDPVEVQTKKLMDTNSMVEEFMLLANIAAAERIYEHFPDCALLRRHPSPPLSNFDDLVKATRSKVKNFLHIFTKFRPFFNFKF